MEKLYDRQYWANNTTPALNETNLNALSQAVDEIDDRLIDVADDVVSVGDINLNPPYINGTNGHWMVYSVTARAYVDSGVSATAEGFLPLTGGTMTGDINMAEDAGIFATGDSEIGTSTNPFWRIYGTVINAIDDIHVGSDSYLAGDDVVIDYVGDLSGSAVDTAPTSGSSHIITSDGVYSGDIHYSDVEVTASSWITGHSIMTSTLTNYGYSYTLYISGITTASWCDVEILDGIYSDNFAIETESGQVTLWADTQPDYLKFRIYYKI